MPASLVELVSALKASKPVVMLVGAQAKPTSLAEAGAGTGELRFVPDASQSMMSHLSLLVDVSRAVASFEADRVRPAC